MKKPKIGDTVTLAKFTNVVPMFLSMVTKPASKQFWTERAALDQAGLQEMEAGVILAGRSEDAEIANVILTIRNKQVPEGEKRAYRIAFPITRVDKTNRVVYGLAYCPPLDNLNTGEISLQEYEECVDTYGSCMDSETLKSLAHAYMEQSRAIDTDHTFQQIGAVPVESWITREATAEYPYVGAWVCGVKVNDDAVWGRVESGELSSFSIAVLCSFEPVEVRIASREVRMDQDYGFDGITARKCMPFKDLPLAGKDVAWDASGAKANVAKYSSSDESGDNATIDWAQYELAFLWVDETKKDSFGSYKFPFADVIDGELQAVPKAIYAAAGRLEGSSLSADDKTKCQAHMEKYYKKLNETAPWNQSAEGGRVDGEPAQRVDPKQGGSTDPTPPVENAPVVEPVVVVESAPAARNEEPPKRVKRQAGDFTAELVAKVAQSDPTNHIWYALYAIQDFVWETFYQCFYDNSLSIVEAKAEIIHACQELSTFTGEKFQAYADATQTRSGTPEEQKDALLSMRTELAAKFTTQLAQRVGKKICKANLDKIQGASDMLADVIKNATDIVIEESAEDGDMKKFVDDVVARMTALEKKVNALPTADAIRAPAIERAEALTTKITALESDLAKARKDLDALIEDAPVGTVTDRGGHVNEPEGKGKTVTWRGVEMPISLLQGGQGKVRS